MKKINWFSRLFMHWGALVDYINQDANGQIESLKSQVKTAAEIFNERISGLQSAMQERDEHLRSLQDQLTRVNTELTQLRAEKTAREDALHKLESAQNQEKINFQTEIAKLSATLEDANHERSRLQNDIATKLNTLSRIEQTFFAKTGNKGKGNLGELQLESMLSSSSVPSDLYTKNLMVGRDVVEFAIRTSAVGAAVEKWIPVDSKVVEADLDDQGNSIVDEQFARKVLGQAKEVSKYVNKKNTTNFGLLVLQSDELYIKLFNDNRVVFDESIRNYKVHVASPSFFIQLAWALSQLLEIYTMVQKDEKMYVEIRSMLASASKFAINVQQAYEKLETAMATHYPTLEKRGNNLVKKFYKDEKIKLLPKLKSVASDDGDDLEIETENEQG